MKDYEITVKIRNNYFLAAMRKAGIYTAAEVLRHRFGLDGYQELTLEETAKIFGVNRERIRQIEHRAIRKTGETMIYNKRTAIIEEQAALDAHERRTNGMEGKDLG